jgi:hypothetical protein
MSDKSSLHDPDDLMREFEQLVPRSQTAPGALSPEEIGLLPEVYNYLAVLHNEDRPETRFRRHLAMEEAKRLELEKAQHQLETHRKDVLSMCEQADQYLERSRWAGTPLSLVYGH